MKLALVGSVAYDDILSPEGARQNLLGGSATYASFAAARFTDVGVVAVVGEDFSPEHTRLFSERGIDTTNLAFEQGRTFRWAGEYSLDFTSRTTHRTELNVFERFNPRMGDTARAAELLFLGNIAPELQLSVLDQAAGARFVALDTMNLWITTRREALLAVLPRVDLLVINDEESHLLTGLRNVHRAAERVLALGPKAVIIKRGEYGSALYAGDQAFLLPAFPVRRVIDPTGAGDSFAGGLLGYLAREGRTDFDALRRAVVVGTIVASFTVEDFSVSRLLSLTPAELRARLQRFAQHTAWSDVEV